MANQSGDVHARVEAITKTIREGLAPDRGPRFALRPDAQGFDEIRITTVPRYKTSGLSGDEWRISAKTEFLRKGKVVYETYWGNVQNAANGLGADLMRAGDDGRGFYGGGGDTCDQEGCAEKATAVFRLKQLYCREGHATPPMTPTHRQFCLAHMKRGDCGLEDSDQNYELVSLDGTTL